MSVGTPTLEDLLRSVMDRAMANLYVAGVGRVEAYDVDAQTADIRPMVTRRVPGIDPDLPEVQEEDPVIPSVRVLHPRGNGWSLHIPLAVGDSVLLVFLDTDPTNWLRTGDVSPAADSRVHHPAHAVAIAGLFPSSNPIQGADGANVTLTRGDFTVAFTPDRMEVGGASDAAALASKVDDLAAKFNAHIHTTTATDVAEALGVISPPTVTYTGGPSASEKLKVGG